MQLEERALGHRPQLDMFAPTPTPEVTSHETELVARLRAVDLNALSPREAHALLAELQNLLAHGDGAT
jgi:DNA mismatch repair protein MutS